MRHVKTIAVFHCSATVGSAWACAEGICLTLERMGYEVFDCGRPQYGRITLEQLQSVDLIILSAAEWYTDELQQCFGVQWKELKAVKIAWFAESAHRDDRDFNFAGTRAFADLCYYPAYQDAVEFSGLWLPFGVDTEIFNPKPVPRSINAGFLGAMYPKRIEYVKRIQYPITHLHSVSDLDVVKSFNLLAEAYSSVRIFVNFPALSRLLVTKVTEVLACRTLLITPRLDHPSAEHNLTQFVDRKHLVYYDPENPEALALLIDYYLQNIEKAEQIAEAGYQKVIQEDSLALRLKKIIGDVELIQTHPKLIQGRNLPQLPVETSQIDTDTLPLISTGQGRYFITNSKETIQAELLNSGRFEPLGARLAIAMQPLCPGAILDVGANIGVFTVPVAIALPQTMVISFEPQRMVFMQLCANVLANRLTQVFARNEAVGESYAGQATTLVPFFNVFAENYTGSVSLDQGVQTIRGAMSSAAEPSQWASVHDSIALVSLDACCSIHSIGFIKVDVEGMEIQVLRGGEGILRKQKPVLFFEAWRHPEFKTLHDELLAYVMGLGYSILQIGEDCFAYHPLRVSKSQVYEQLAVLGLQLP